MAAQHLINVDLAKVFGSKAKKGLITILAWGDEVEVVKRASDHLEVKVTKYVEDVRPLSGEPVSQYQR